MKVVAILLSLLTSILLIASFACAPQPTALQKSSAIKEEKAKDVTEKITQKDEWVKTLLPDEGEVVAFGESGRVVISGSGTILQSLDGGQSWQPLISGDGDYFYTKDGGKTYLADDSNPASRIIKVKDLCSVESSVIIASRRLYLTTVCEHTEQVWSVPIETRSGLWHIRNFTYKNDPENGAYGPRSNIVNAGGRILVDAVLPEGPALMTTNDEGATWRPFWHDKHSEALIVALDFINGQQGWMLKADGILLSTIDGGHTWKMVSTLPSEAAGHLFSMDFIDITTGFLVGEKGLILATNDGGHNWKQQASNTKQSLYKVAAADGQQAWAVGERGTVIETKDGGAHWRRVELNLDKNIDNLAVKDKVAWIVVDNYVYRSL